MLKKGGFMGIISRYSSNFIEAFPKQINEGVYGATFYLENTPLYLRMEQLTEENKHQWTTFKTFSGEVARYLSYYLHLAETSPKELINFKASTGFTDEEFDSFCQELEEKVKNVKSKCLKERLDTLRSFSQSEMYTGPINLWGQQRPLAKDRYITYITKNPNFSMQSAFENEKKLSYESLKIYLKCCQDVLIVVGSDFSKEKSFENRGIFGNPWWIFKEEYRRLSMYIHGFCGVVAAEFFQKKASMEVSPLHAMQCIIQKHLKPGDGRISLPDSECTLNSDGSVTHRDSHNTSHNAPTQDYDITNVKFKKTPASKDNDHKNTIRLAAMCRIYFEDLELSEEPTVIDFIENVAFRTEIGPTLEGYRHAAVGCQIL